MKALVTGGAGFIGSHLVDKLLLSGYSVSVIDYLSTGSIKNLTHLADNKNFQFVNEDIITGGSLEELVKDADIVFHLAAAVGVKYIVNDPLGSILTNVSGTERVFQFAFKYWKKVALASTSEVYGKSQKIPLEEDDDRTLGPTRINRWSYSASKAIDEHIAFAYHQKGLPMVILRFFNAYGPRINEQAYGTVVAQFIRQALRGEPVTVHAKGEQTRCFTFIEDTVDGILRASTAKEAEGEVLNIGNSKEVTILQLAELIKKITRSTSPIQFVAYSDYYGQSYEDTPRRVPSVKKAKERTGFEAKTPLEEGLEKTIAWCKENYTIY